jgi:hypothetical protein
VPPKKNLNHYEVLGARSDANYATLRSAYRKKMRALHPDAQSSQVNPEEISAVSAAWEVLSRSDRRREYDKTLSIGQGVHESKLPFISVPCHVPFFLKDDTLRSSCLKQRRIVLLLYCKGRTSCPCRCGSRYG